MKPIITPRPGGEYSTVTLADGTVETMWFPENTGEQAVLVGRTYPRSVSAIAAEHIAEYERG